jgi:hypothetical protein
VPAEHWFLWAGLGLCLFALWAIARHDWLRLTRPSRRVLAEVIGHDRIEDGDGTFYAARYRFHDGGALREVVDPVGNNSRKPEPGTILELAYPEGRPDLARPPRPVTWPLVYVGLAYGTGVLGAKLLGFI